MIELKDGEYFTSNGKRYCFKNGQTKEVQCYLGGEPVSFKEVAINQPFYIQMVKVDDQLAISSYKSIDDAYCLSDHEPVEINVPKNVCGPLEEIGDMNLRIGDVVSVELTVCQISDNEIRLEADSSCQTWSNILHNTTKARLVNRK